jgi:hypothetical protein
MKIKIFSAAVALTALGLATAGAYAQTSNPVPATPAPAPTELVYLAQLPSAAALVSAAKAEGATVIKIDQTSTEVVAVYKDANGQITTVSYQILPAAEAAAVTQAAAAPATGAAATTAVVPATTTVIYGSPGYYYGPYGYYGGYYPWGWYAPIGIRVGFGFHGGRRW